MRGTVGEFLTDRLMLNGVDHFFGIPGDYSINFYERLSNKIKAIGTTNEMCAGYAADAYARIKGIGCVCVTYCVGGFSVLNAIAGAYAERSPVIVISGSPGIKERKEKTLLHHMVRHFECQHHMFENITCANTVLRDPERAGYEIDRVLTALQEHKQPIYIEIPRDIVNKPIRYDAYSQLTPKREETDVESLRESVGEVVDYINRASRPVIWAGVEMSRFGFSKKLLKFAEATNIPVASSALGKSVFDETHPLSLGVYCESIADAELKKYMDGCDCLIMLGVMMTDINTGFLPIKYGNRRIVLSTSDSLQVKNHNYSGVRFCDFVESLFSAKGICKRVNPEIPTKVKESFVVNSSKKITISRLFQGIDSMVRDKNIAVVSDIGESLFGSMDITVKGHSFISNGFYASMGFAIPAAVGVNAARPDLRPVVIVGDGAFQMTGLEFANMVRRKIPAIVFVLNNGGYGTERLLSDGNFNDIADIKYSKITESTGGKGFSVYTEDDLQIAMNCALECVDCPVLIEVHLDKKDHIPSLQRMFANLHIDR